MRININITASHPSLTHVTMLLHVTGGYAVDGYIDDILEAQGGKWRKVGKLTRRRSSLGVSVVNFKDFAEYCNN